MPLTLWQHEGTLLSTIGDGTIDVADNGCGDLHLVLFFNVFFNRGPADTTAVTSSRDAFLVSKDE